MNRPRYFSPLLIFLTFILAFNLTAYTAVPQTATASPTPFVFKTGTSAPTRTRTPTPTLTPTITLSLSPVVQTDADPLAWLDGAIHLDQFSAQGALVVHFNTPMSPESSSNPLLTWPDVPGTVSWNEAKTILTFTPKGALEAEKAYTFFLDPGLQSASGKQLKNVPEWIAHVQDGVKVVTVSPQPGQVQAHALLITVTFDRDMDQTLSESGFSVAPSLLFEKHWKNTKTLELTLKEPLRHGQRYDLTLSGLVAADGTTAEVYRWFYSVPALDTTLRVQEKTIRVEFSQALDTAKSGLPFSISPALEGKWAWDSSQAATFNSVGVISAATEYTINVTAPLVDATGAGASIAPLKFIGNAPIHLSGMNKYDDSFSADTDTTSFSLSFDLLVDHASAEKAFSLSPSVPGQITWETDKDGTSETLTYALDELFQLNKQYVVQIDKTIKDRQGQPILFDDYKQRFSSSYYGSLDMSFGEYGDNIQVVDANGSRKIQVSGNNPDASFAAYRFDMIDFAKLYADHYHFRSGAGVRDIPIPDSLKASVVWTGTTQRKSADNDRRSTTEITLPEELAPGLYVLNIRVKNILFDQIFLAVTRNTLVVKNDGENLFVWLTDINGGNVPDAEIRVYSDTGEKVREGKTDAEGQYRVPVPEGAESMLVFARTQEKDKPEDVTLTGHWYTSFPYYNDDYVRDNDEFALRPSLLYMFYGYTERPIYRPGQQVNFKVLMRRDHDLRYELFPVNTPVKVSVFDSRRNLVETLDLLTNRFGTINGSFTLTDGAMLGEYEIRTVLDDFEDSTYFQVEDYRKPDYQVEITSLQPEKKNRFVKEDEVKLKVKVSYYFGEPLANIKLSTTLYGGDPTLGLLRSLTTDENGEAILSFKAPYKESNNYSYYWNSADRRLHLEVSADDGSHQVVAATYSFTVLPAAETLSLNTGGYYLSPDKPVKVQVHVADLENQPVANRKLTLSLDTWDRTDYKFKNLKDTYSLQTDAQGNAIQELSLNTGYYNLILNGEDAEGNETITRRWIYVFKDSHGWFQAKEENRVTITADQDSYKPYEKARFAIESSFSGPALLTFERGNLINTKMVQLTAPLTMIETDIIPEYAPNIYVVVNAWRPGSRTTDFYMNSSVPDSHLVIARTHVMVDSTKKALDIRIETDKKTYAPGEKVTATIQVTDSNGKPAPAELSLGVVDEAIFALAEDTSGEIFNVFYGPRQHGVNTYNSMEPIRYVPGGRGGGGGNPPPQGPRSDFLDTSAWFPALETDASGKVVVTFDLPDNTTSWRLSVRAITLNHQVGQALTNIETKKEVFLRPSLPRVLTSGDQATLTAFVHNYGQTARVVNVNFSADGLDVQGLNDQQITLQPGDVQPVGWRVRVLGANPTQVTIAVSGADGGPLDAVRLPLLIQPSAVRDLQNQSGQLRGELTLGLPVPRVERRTSRVTLTLNRTMAGTLLNGLEYLTGYPYGCVEQTMSRALPNAVVGRAASQLGVGGPALQAKVAPLIKASIQRLYGFQHYDGGWGWWTDDESDAYETAWVLFGLAVMKDAGHAVDEDVLERGADWLKRNMDSRYTSSGGEKIEEDIRTQAYSLFSMAEAGFGDKEKTLALATASAKELDPFSQAALALALARLGEKEQAQAIIDMLSESAFTKGDQVYWPQPSYDGEYHQKTMASTLRTTALILLAYARIEPQSKLVPGMVAYLSSQRKGVYGWGTTNETSFTILALTEYLKSQQDAATNTPYEVFVNDKSFAQGTLAVGTANIVLDIPMTELNDGLNILRVTTQGDQPIYYDLSTRYDLLNTDTGAAGKIQVKRTYVDPTTNQPITELKAGQLVQVSLEVDSPQTASFIAVEDYVPGGLEALNEGLNMVTVGTPPSEFYEDFTRYSWQEYGYNYKEIRGDRVVFFITNFGKGAHKFTYFARATTLGEFTVLPTQVYAMYDSSMWGRSDMGKMVVK